MLRSWLPASLLILVFLTSATAQTLDYPLGGASRPSPQMRLNRGDGQYKRIHQFALRMILLNRQDEAEEFLNGHRDRHPEDPETHYMLGVLHAQRGELDVARKMFEAAVELGLPTERIVAGPRGALGSMLAHDYWKGLQEQHRSRPVHGPMVGDVSASGAAVWVRTAVPGEVRVIASRTADLTDPIESPPAASRSDGDYTAVARLQGLEPDTEYYYAVSINDQRPESAPEHQRFRTFPARGSRKGFRLAFGGGAGYVPPHERMWNTIHSFAPLALLLLGDNTYIDDPESMIMQQYTYQRRQSRPEFRTLTASTAVFSIWDDHDFGTNDCWGGPYIEVPWWKKQNSYRVWKQNWPNPGFAGGDLQPGCWYAFSIGDVDFIMLDCRYYRTNPRSESPSMLGPVQKAWMKEQLKQATGTFKVLCSSVPWDYRTKGDSLDTWNGFKSERDEIFDFLTAEKIGGVILMSADRHRSDAWKIERPEDYPLYEFNSSRLTNQHVHPTMEKRGAIFSYNAKQSFGLVGFDLQPDDPQVTYTVISIDGERIADLTVKRSELEPAAGN